MTRRDLIVIGASAGGVQALRAIVGDLPGDLDAALIVVLHVPESGQSVLPDILRRAGSLRARHARDGDLVERGSILVAPPGKHLVLRDDRVALGNGPRENGHRPALDVTFRTAAFVYGPRVVGVVLTGSGDDGAVGLTTIKARGGLAIVQDPADAEHPQMPLAAIGGVAVDHVLPLAAIPRQLVHAIRQDAAASVLGGATGDGDGEQQHIARDLDEQAHGRRVGSPSVLSCPDCGGILWELREGNLLRYRCHVGHAFSLPALADAQDRELETALWTAVRMLRERGVLARRGVERARDSGLEFVVANLERRADDAERTAALIERMLRQDLARPAPATHGSQAPPPGDDAR